MESTASASWQRQSIDSQWHTSWPTIWRKVVLVLLLGLVLSLSWSTLALAQSQSVEERVTPLIEKLTNRNSRRRLEAADALVNIGTPAIPALRQALQSEDSTLRWHVASVLGDLGPEAVSAVPDLTMALQDPDPQVRLYATLALGNVGEAAKPAIPALIAALQDPDPYVRIYAPTSLRKIGAQGDVAVPALIKVLRDPNPRVRLNAAYSLGALGREAELAVPNLVEVLLDPQLYVRLGAVKGLAGIAGAFQDQAQSLSSRKLSTLIVTFDQVLSLLENPDQGFTADDIARIRRPLNALKAEQETRLWDKGLQFLQQHPWWGAIAIYAVILPTVCGLLLYIAPLWLLYLNDLLKPYTDVVVPFLGINVPIRSVLLVGWFHYHPRVLDAWVQRHVSTARTQFAQKPTVRDRQYHIPLTVVLDGTTIPQLNPAELARAFNAKRSRLVIWGEGGIGKTSLACQLGKWAMAEHPTDRLSRSMMLPILLEEAWITKETPRDNGTALLDAIRGQLQALIDLPESVSQPLMLQLLRHQRLLVIVDRFSEMPSYTRETLQPDRPDFPVNALIVTSRTDESLGRINRTTLTPLKIESNKLSSFMEAYLMQQGQRDRLNDTEFFAACQRLSSLVGDRQITVLLAKLYAEQLMRSLNSDDTLSPSTLTLPEDIPGLMLGYLNELNREITDHPLDNRILHEDAKALAWACVQAQLYPTPIARKVAIATLQTLNREDPEFNLHYLEHKLQVIETLGTAQDRIRFCLDPLAEYLAALHIIEQWGRNNQYGPNMSQQIAQELSSSKPIKAKSGFLLALQDVSQTLYPSGDGIELKKTFT